MDTLHDSELVAAYSQGDELALNELLDRYKARIFGYILSKVHDENLANDIFQDAFVKAIVYIKKGKYNEEGKFINWMMRITHNLVIDHFRANKRLKTISETSFANEDFNIFDIIPCENINIEDYTIQEQIKNDIVKLVTQLPEDQKEVVRLRLYSNLSFKEIAEETGVSINTALGRMRYAVMNLRKLMEEHNITLSL